MLVLSGTKKVKVRLTITDTAGTPQTTEKTFLRTSVPSGAGDPASGSDFSNSLAMFTGTKSGTVEIIENAISQVDRSHAEVADADEIKDNFGSLYTQIEG